MHNLIFLVILNSSFAFSQSSDPRDAYIEASEKQCLLIHKNNGQCAPHSNFEKSIFSNLQMSCESLRKANGCEEFENQQLAALKKNPNPRADSFQRREIKSKIIGCSTDRICQRDNFAISCLRGGLHGALDVVLAIPNLAMAMYEFDKKLLDTPAKVLIENIKKELGNKWYCYTPEARLEMMCSLSSFVIPGGAIAGKVASTFKNRFPELARLNALNAKISNEEKIAKPVEWSIEEIKKNPQIAIWTLKRTQPEKAKELTDQVLSTLENGDIVKSTLKTEGAYRGYILEFKDGSKALWKPDEFDDYILRTNMAGNEKAAYLIDQKLGLDLIPVTTKRDYNGIPGSVQLWVNDLDKVPFADDPIQYGFIDSLLSNYDRHSGNVASKGGKQIAIDHGNAFNEKTDIRFFKDPIEKSINRYNSVSTLQEKEIIISQIKNVMPSQEVISKLRTTSNVEWTQLLSKELPASDVKLFLERKDKILEWTSKAEKTFGNRMYPDGPFSPLMRSSDPK